MDFPTIKTKTYYLLLTFRALTVPFIRCIYAINWHLDIFKDIFKSSQTQLQLILDFFFFFFFITWEPYYSITSEGHFTTFVRGGGGHGDKDPPV